MQVLLTNDDGVNAPGLGALAQRLCAEGHRVVVLAPAHDCSGSGAAIGPVRLDRTTLLQRTTLPGLQSVRAYALPSPPAMCVLTAFLGNLDLVPDVVVSGINAGPNTGRVILHSGTVGAALAAAQFGARALAVSHGAMKGPRCWSGAASLAAAMLPWLCASPPATVINLNVPQTSDGEIPSVRIARLAEFNEGLRIQIADEDDGAHELSWRPSAARYPADTDTALLAKGFATITSLQGIAESKIDLNQLTATLDV